MFYLRSYLKALWYGRSVGLFYGILSVLILIFAANIFTFKQNFIDQNKNPYFNALFTATADPSLIVQKLKDIPGVENVVLSQKLHLRPEVKSVLKLSTSAALGDLMAAKYVNLKVELSPHMEKRSQDLIMEYLRRMAGKTKITMSEIIDTKSERVANDPIRNFVLEYGHYLALAFLSIVWVFATWAVGQKLQNRAYLINMYQRRSLVIFKIFSSGQAFWVLLSTGLCLYLGGSLGILLCLATVLTLTGLSILSIRKNEFIKA